MFGLFYKFHVKKIPRDLVEILQQVKDKVIATSHLVWLLFAWKSSELNYYRAHIMAIYLLYAFHKASK